MSSLPWIDIAEADLGITEVPGSRSNPTIMQWAKELGEKGRYYTDDSIPWCGEFMGHVIQAANCIQTLAKVPNPLWARDWLLIPEKCDPQYGSILVFGRNGGGHVAFYISEDDNYYHVLGGNQNDAVNVVRHAKSSLLGSRWPVEYPELKGVTGRVYNPDFVPGS